MTFNGSTGLDDTRLQLTSGAANQAGTAWFNTPQNIQTFTNDFTFQLSNPSADGMTFTIQNTGLTALGPAGGGLGYGPDEPGGDPESARASPSNSISTTTTVKAATPPASTPTVRRQPFLSTT